MEQDKDKSYGKALKSARELVHTVLGKAWEDTSSIFRQIPSIGPKAIGKLGLEGVRSESDFLDQSPGEKQ
jgi:ATP-dependent DNA helicase HFM1/MER3